MSKLVYMGDPHLTASTAWQEIVSSKVIEWLENTCPENTKGYTFIIAGDVCDNMNHNSSLTVSLLTRFFNAFKCDEVIVLTGNHDLVRDASGNQQLLYSFVKYLKTSTPITLIEYPQELKRGNQSIVCLPFYKTPIHCLVDMNENPESFRRKWGLKTDYDLCIGHQAYSHTTLKNLPVAQLVDAKKLFPNTKYFLAGHIHYVPDNTYLDSMYAVNKGEQGPRSYQVFENNKYTNRFYPTFCKMYTIAFGEPLPSPEDCIQVFTISNCSNIEKAQAFYGEDVLIRKTISMWGTLSAETSFKDSLQELHQKNMNIMVDKQKVIEAFLNSLNTTECKDLYETSSELFKEALKLIAPTN